MRKRPDISETREYVKGELSITFYANEGDFFIKRALGNGKRQDIYLDAEGIEFLLDIIKETKL
jgi:hypothetical protein